MGTWLKLLFGLLLIALGAWLLSQYWNNFLYVFFGVFPAFVVFIGILIVWVEVEELKAQKEDD